MSCGGRFTLTGTAAIEATGHTRDNLLTGTFARIRVSP
jgi:hypothetical protein